jgi:hypothetical protein
MKAIETKKNCPRAADNPALIKTGWFDDAPLKEKVD